MGRQSARLPGSLQVLAPPGMRTDTDIFPFHRENSSLPTAPFRLTRGEHLRARRFLAATPGSPGPESLPVQPRSGGCSP